MALEEETQNLTISITTLGRYKWKRLPMELASSPTVVQNLTEFIFAGLSYEMVVMFLDNIIVLRRNFKENLNRFEQVFQRLAENGLEI